MSISDEVPHICDSNYKGGIPSFPGSPQFELAPVEFLMWATTPAGRQSKLYRICRFRRLKHSGHLHSDGHYQVSVYIPSAHYSMTTLDIYELAKKRFAETPYKLPKGYVWHGPALIRELHAPTVESASFRFKPPSGSDGILFGYAAVALPNGEVAVRLARKILSERPVPA